MIKNNKKRNLDKKETMKELFESHLLVDFPKDEEIARQFAIMVFDNENEVQLLHQIDEIQQEEENYDNSVQKNFELETKPKKKKRNKNNGIDLTLSNFPPISQLEVRTQPMIKTKKLLDNRPKTESDLKTSLIMVEKESEQLDSSFEDLTEEIRLTMQQLEEKEANKEQAVVKLFMKEDSRLIEDNYIQANQSWQVDWFALYAKKQFDFRSDQGLLHSVRNDICLHRVLAPKSSFYDTIAFGAKARPEVDQLGQKILKELKNPSYTNNVINRAVEDALMASQINMGSNKQEQSLTRRQMLTRQSAWCVMLSIDFTSDKFDTFETVYFEVLANNNANDDKQNKVLQQIRLDVARTFRPFGLKFLNADPCSGKNKLYNLLKVYALVLDPEIGYTQGMNFIAALILLHVPNEVLACQIFMKVLEKDNWARMYISSTPKLFDFAQNLTDRLAIEQPKLGKFLSEKQVMLEVVLASPLMTLFANQLSFSEATQVLNLFILEGEIFLQDLFVNLLTEMSEEIFKYTDLFELQAYMSKEMIEKALTQGKFYPGLQE